nr:hypothetical protein Iba_chr13bCG10770 [Ipomoea batatas]
MWLPRSKLHRRRDRSPEEDYRWGCLTVLLLRRNHRRRRVRESHSCSFLLDYPLSSSKPLRRRRSEQTQLPSWRLPSTTRSLLGVGSPLPYLFRRTGKGGRRMVPSLHAHAREREGRGDDAVQPHITSPAATRLRRTGEVALSPLPSFTIPPPISARPEPKLPSSSLAPSRSHSRRKTEGSRSRHRRPAEWGKERRDEELLMNPYP